MRNKFGPQRAGLAADRNSVQSAGLAAGARLFVGQIISRWWTVGDFLQIQMQPKGRPEEAREKEEDEEARKGKKRGLLAGWLATSGRPFGDKEQSGGEPFHLGRFIYHSSGQCAGVALHWAVCSVHKCVRYTQVARAHTLKANADEQH